MLGPSHHVRLSGCAISGMERYQTPLYDLAVDTQGKSPEKQYRSIKQTKLSTDVKFLFRDTLINRQDKIYSIRYI